MNEAQIDSKLLGKPSKFDGDENTWEDWSFTLRSYASTLGPPDGTWAPSDWMELSESQGMEIHNTNLTGPARTFSNQL